jgi:hypothetical protein
MDKDDGKENRNDENARKRRKIVLQNKSVSRPTTRSQKRPQVSPIPRVPLTQVSNTIPPVLTPLNRSCSTNFPNGTTSQLHTQPSTNNREHLRFKQAKHIQTLGINLLNKFSEPTLPSSSTTPTHLNQLGINSQQKFSHPNFPSNFPQTSSVPNRKRKVPSVHFDGATAEISDDDNHEGHTSDESDFDNIDEGSSDSDNEEHPHEQFEGNY